MAKGARASTTKANNVRLKSKVFGPVETERTARLSAKLLELASQPKPARAEKSLAIDDEEATVGPDDSTKLDEKDAMEVDSTKPKLSKSKIEKRKQGKRKASIVFPKYKDKKPTSSRRKH